MKPPRWPGPSILLALLAAGWPRASASAAPVRFVVTAAATGQPLPCRIHLHDQAGQPVHPPDAPFWKDHFVCDGSAILDLNPGCYDYEIDRGPEYFLEKGAFTVQAGQPRELAYGLRRLADLAREGWWSGEMHGHRALRDMPLLMRAEDLHVAQAITWWNDANLWDNQPLPENPLMVVDSDRFYHVLAGEDERGGGALLYFHLPEPLPIAGSAREHPSAMQFLSEARRRPSPNLWVDIEKPFWWDVPVWAASGLVDSVGLAHNHMQRGGVLDNEAWGKPRDPKRFPGPQGNGFWTQHLYYHLLNAGLRLPPSAGSASGVLPNPVGYNRAYVQTGGPLRYEDWWRNLRAGRVFVSNGPLLRCRANGAWPGEVFRATDGGPLVIQLEARLDSRDPLRDIEIIRNGQIERTVPAAALKGEGSLGTLTFRESGWFLVRVLADLPETFRFASTGPFYVEVGEAPRRVSRASARFFLDWVRERRQQMPLPDPAQRAAVAAWLDQAEAFWKERLERANAE